jgi:cytochrome c oxidase subunit 5a
MQGYDNFPEPKIVIACLEACRRLNEHSVAVRYLEALKVKFFSI